MAKRRIMKELEDIIQKETEGVILELIDDSNLFEFQGVIIGPPDTPFEGGHFKFELKLNKDYPFKPPKFQFKTKIGIIKLTLEV